MKGGGVNLLGSRVQERRVHTCVNNVTTVALSTTSFCMAESAVLTNDCKDGKSSAAAPVPDLRFL